MSDAQGKIARLRRELEEALREIGLSGESQRTFDSALDRLLAANGGDVSAHQNAVVLHSADGANPSIRGEFESTVDVMHVDSFYEADKRVVGAPGSIINQSHEFLKNDAIEQRVSGCFQYGSGNHSPQVPADRVAELEARYTARANDAQYFERRICEEVEKRIALEDEVTRLNGRIDDQLRTIQVLMVDSPEDTTTPTIIRIWRLEAECARLRKDAERYQYWKDAMVEDEDTMVDRMESEIRKAFESAGRMEPIEEDYDAGIDAALAAKGGE